MPCLHCDMLRTAAQFAADNPTTTADDVVKAALAVVAEIVSAPGGDTPIDENLADAHAILDEMFAVAKREPRGVRRTTTSPVN